MGYLVVFVGLELVPGVRPVGKGMGCCADRGVSPVSSCTREKWRFRSGRRAPGLGWERESRGSGEAGRVRSVT